MHGTQHIKMSVNFVQISTLFILALIRLFGKPESQQKAETAEVISETLSESNIPDMDRTHTLQ
jgi:hypothetical protein